MSYYLFLYRENYSKFIQLGALPIVITHDQPHIHEVYATIGRTTGSLTFTPSFVLGEMNDLSLIFILIVLFY